MILVKKFKIVNTNAIICNVTKLTRAFLSFIRAIKISLDTRYIPLIILSKKDDDQLVSLFLSAGVDFCFIGIYNPAELMYKIQVLTFQKKIRLSLLSKTVVYNNTLNNISDKVYERDYKNLEYIQFKYSNAKTNSTDFHQINKFLANNIVLEVKKRFDGIDFIFVAQVYHQDNFKSNILVKKNIIKTIFLEIISGYDFHPTIFINNFKANNIELMGTFIRVDINNNKLTIVDLDVSSFNSKEVEKIIDIDSETYVKEKGFTIEQVVDINNTPKKIDFYIAKHPREILTIEIGKNTNSIFI